MKKTNIVLFAVAVAVSAFLLWLWFDLGFYHIDSPLDLVISIIWWLVIVALIAGVAKVEKTRRQKIRTMYVAPDFLFNSEAGVIALEGRTVLDALEQTIAQLKYDFTNESIEDENKAALKKVVRTKTYKPARSEDEEPTWEGEVVAAVPDAQPVAFSTKAELASLLGA